VAKEKSAERGQYSEVVTRLEGIVEALENGQLSLEDSLDRFAEGVQLVKRGERLLADAEKRIEQLLSEDGKTAEANLEASPGGIAHGAPSNSHQMTRTARKTAGAAKVEEEDVPF
jgi:exodeoxyribonuclease VII small subunit